VPTRWIKDCLLTIVKRVPLHALKVYEEVNVQFQSILISVLNASGQLHDPVAVSLVERTPITH
jgi:hypothetical protein